mgnify:CR=1 FL=1
MPSLGELVAPRRMGRDFRWLLASSWTSNIGDGVALAHLDGSGHLLPEPGAAVRHGEREVGRATSVARHHELGPVALVVLKRSVDPDADLLVDCDGGAVAAGQEVVVSAEGVSTDRPAPRGPVARGLAPRAPRG